jgi:acylphosphatase
MKISDEPMIKSIVLVISGRVQGVGFRYFIFQKAKNLAIKGWVKNNTNGSVIIEAEGEEKAITQFISYCRQGPRLAKVEKVELKEQTIKEYLTFSIE